MKVLLFIILLTFVGCRSRRAESVAIRRADSVAGLWSIKTTAIERETVWQTVTVRPDTTGRLRVVAVDIVRGVGREVETVADTSSSFAFVDSLEETKETVTATAAPGGTTGGVVGSCGFVWLVLAAFVLLFGKYIQRLWKSAH
jgi:hypothetical protein